MSIKDEDDLASCSNNSPSLEVKFPANITPSKLRLPNKRPPLSETPLETRTSKPGDNVPVASQITQRPNEAHSVTSPMGGEKNICQRYSGTLAVRWPEREAQLYHWQMFFSPPKAKGTRCRPNQTRQPRAVIFTHNRALRFQQAMTRDVEKSRTISSLPRSNRTSTAIHTNYRIVPSPTATTSTSSLSPATIPNQQQKTSPVPIVSSTFVYAATKATQPEA